MIDDGWHHEFQEFDDLPDTMFMLYFKNISGKWSLRPRIFLTRDMAEYIGSFFERPTYIVPVTTHTPELHPNMKLTKVRMPKTKKVKKVKVRKVKVPK